MGRSRARAQSFIVTKDKIGDNGTSCCFWSAAAASKLHVNAIGEWQTGDVLSGMLVAELSDRETETVIGRRLKPGEVVMATVTLKEMEEVK